MIPGTRFAAYVGEQRGWFCTHASPGCANCYAERWNGFRGNGLAYIAQNKDNVEMRLENLMVPIKQTRPRSIFVNSMTDTFLDLIPEEILDKLFAVMTLAEQHTFFVLTKRADRMAAYLNNPRTYFRVYRDNMRRMLFDERKQSAFRKLSLQPPPDGRGVGPHEEVAECFSTNGP